MPDAAISAHDLVKFFPPARSGWRSFLHPIARPTERALNGISFEVYRGESVAIVGPNGAGKTTLLRILATLVVPTRGRALIGGHDSEKESALARRRLGYHTGGDEGFYARLTGRENLAFFAAMNNLSAPEIRDRIASVSAWMQIAHELDRQVRTLSTGITHRLGLARALLHDPSVLLLDEPTRSLDPLAAASFRRLLKEEIVRRRGTSLLFASHSLEEVGYLADRVLVLEEGKLAAFASPNDIQRSTKTSTFAEAIGCLLRKPLEKEQAP